MRKTSETATGFAGDQLYQQRARLILPILVRQAEAGKPIYYSDLAQEVGMPNPRNLNFPLGCIGDALNTLATEWDEEIPHIQSIVINQRDDTPGPGFDGFLEDRGFRWKDARERKAVLFEYRAKVSAYPYWGDVLSDLGLERSAPNVDDLIAEAGRRGGGEGPEHAALKEHVRTHPSTVGLSPDHSHGKAEQPLPSGDCVDVVFQSRNRLLAIEVKPAGCGNADVLRGLFQCVKYRSVMEAEVRYRQQLRTVEVKLVLGGDFPDELVPLRNSLAIEVIEKVQVGTRKN